MKVKKEQLEQTVKRELGIDLTTYRSPETIEAILNLITFPGYIISAFVWSIFIVFITAIGSWLIIDVDLTSGLIFAMISVFLFLGETILLGILIITHTIKKDLIGVLQFTISLIKNVLKDTNQASDTFKEKPKEKFQLLYKGVIQIVIIPSIGAAIANKIPLIGSVFEAMISAVLYKVSEREVLSDEKLKEVTPEDPSQWITSLSTYLSSCLALTKKVLSTAFLIVNIPIQLIFLFNTTLIAGLVYLFI